jgi:hypothetical protein
MRLLKNSQAEDYEMICNSIERLIGYIANLKNVHGIVEELTHEMKSVKSDLIMLKDRKRKEASTSEIDQKIPNHKRFRRC